MSRFSKHIRQNVYGLVAVFIALTMGTAYATHPGGTNTISTDDIQNQAVTTPKLASQAATTGKIASEAVDSSRLALGAVTTPRILDGAVRTAKLRDGAVTPIKSSGLVPYGDIPWAVVNQNGTVARSNPIGVTAERQGGGNYEVEFGGRGLDPCASIAQISRSFFTEGAPGPGEASSNQGEMSGSAIDVRTFDSAGSPANRPFTVHVLCDEMPDGNGGPVAQGTAGGER
jgi:hypothetical protein